MQLSFKDLKHTFRSPAGEARTVVNIPDWTVQSGEQLLLQGVSGSGKTTLFNITAGLMRPTEGAVYYGEKSLYKLPEERRDRFRARNVGYVFQNHHLIQSLTAAENVAMPMAFAGELSRKQCRDRAVELLSLMGLSDHVDYRPEKMSTGQRLRVAIARALANTPPVLLADEPTAALDTESAVNVMKLMRDTCREHNAILIVASHDPEVAAGFAKIARLQSGELTVEEIQPA